MVDILGAVFEVVIIHYYFTYLTKASAISQKSIYVLYSLYVLIMASATQINNIHFLLPLIGFSLDFFISFTFSGKWYFKLFFSAVLVVIFMLTEITISSIQMFLTQMDMRNIQSALPAYMVGVFASKLLAFLLVKVLGFNRLDVYEKISMRVFLGLMLTPMTSIIAMYYIIINNAYYNQNPLAVPIAIGTSVLLCISNFFVFYIFENQVKSEQIKVKLSFAEKQIEQQTIYYRELSHRQVEVRTLSHDMKHYLSGIWGYLQDGNHDEAIRGMEKLTTFLQNAVSSFDTGHPAIDAILSVKKQGMDALGIHFDTSIILPPQISVDPLDLCVVLGNALDNAVNACEKFDDPDQQFIRLNISTHPRYLSISIENPVRENDLPSTFFQADKSAVYSHGLGLESIRSIVSRYDGSVTPLFSDGLFRLSAMMKNNQVI